MKKEVVKKILEETEIGYDLISEKFSQTRNKFWGSLAFIKKYVKESEKVLDFGCGNGRLLELFDNKSIEYKGVDISEKLIESARQKYGDRKNVKFIKILPSTKFKNNQFNAIYSIAVFHHIPSEKLRSETAEELFKITNKNGYIIITAWNLWQLKYRKNIFDNWKNKILGKSKLNWNDCWITFTDNQGKVFNRYHHAFTKRDLNNLFEKAGFKIEKIKKIGGNIVLVGKKRF